MSTETFKTHHTFTFNIRHAINYQLQKLTISRSSTENIFSLQQYRGVTTKNVARAQVVGVILSYNLKQQNLWFETMALCSFRQNSYMIGCHEQVHNRSTVQETEKSQSNKSFGGILAGYCQRWALILLSCSFSCCPPMGKNSVQSTFNFLCIVINVMVIF